MRCLFSQKNKQTNNFRIKIYENKYIYLHLTVCVCVPISDAAQPKLTEKKRGKTQRAKKKGQHKKAANFWRTATTSAARNPAEEKHEKIEIIKTCHKQS